MSSEDIEMSWSETAKQSGMKSDKDGKLKQHRQKARKLLKRAQNQDSQSTTDSFRSLSTSRTRGWTRLSAAHSKSQNEVETKTWSCKAALTAVTLNRHIVLLLDEIGASELRSLLARVQSKEARKRSKQNHETAEEWTEDWNSTRQFN